MSHQQQQRSLSADESAESLRKRVCKACDRCRLKKSKCDGASPCSRCKADNSICVFGRERKKSHDKVYPKGYVEMLEQQQGQLVAGLQELYHRSLSGKPWQGPALSEDTGHPLTHDILAALNLLEHSQDGSGEVEHFEEDCEKLQNRLFKEGAPKMRRKPSSISTTSDHHSPRNSISTAQTTPDMTSAAVFKEGLSFSPSPSPFAQSPRPRKRQSVPSPAQQSPLHKSTPLSNDPQFFSQEWALPQQTSNLLLRSNYALQTPTIQQPNNSFADEVADMFRNDQAWMSMSDPSLNGFNGQFTNLYAGNPMMPDFASVDPMEIEFNRYIQGATA